MMIIVDRSARQVSMRRLFARVAIRQWGYCSEHPQGLISLVWEVSCFSSCRQVFARQRLYHDLLAIHLGEPGVHQLREKLLNDRTFQGRLDPRHPHLDLKPFSAHVSSSVAGIPGIFDNLGNLFG